MGNTVERDEVKEQLDLALEHLRRAKRLAATRKPGVLSGINWIIEVMTDFFDKHYPK